jgi:hypothetical protein
MTTLSLPPVPDPVEIVLLVPVVGAPNRSSSATGVRPPQSTIIIAATTPKPRIPSRSIGGSFAAAPPQPSDLERISPF